MSQLTPSDRITHLADLMHRAEMSNGSSVPSNWVLASTGSNKGITWTPQAASSGSVSYGSNAMDVNPTDNGGASTDVSRMDHRHRGVRLISSAGSNSLVGDINFIGGGSVGVTVAGQTIQISGPGTSGGGGSSGSVSLDPFYGDGRDGDVTISGDTTITRDMYYNNLTVNNGVNLDTALLRVFVKGTLTLNGTIRCNGNNGGTGGTGTAGAGGTAGAAGTQQTGGSVQNLPNGAAGRAGSAGGLNANGTNGTASGTPTTFFGINCPAGAVGGQSGSGRSGGTAGAAATGDETTQDKPVWWPRILQWRIESSGAFMNSDLITGRAATGGGGGGAAASGGGGSGGSGSGGGFVVVVARTITGSGTIQAKGGNGGNGGGGLATAQAGGGAGGNGGQGGIAVLITKDRSAWSGSFDVAGGTKGTGGAAGGGAGSTAGSDGNNGNAGRSFSMLLG